MDPSRFPLDVRYWTYEQARELLLLLSAGYPTSAPAGEASIFLHEVPDGPVSGRKKMESEAIGTTAAEREAFELGKNYGHDGGSWVVDGNSTTETLLAVIKASEEGEFFQVIAPELSGPLSGEWADGYTLGRLSDELGVDANSDEFSDLCSRFEDGYFEGFEDEAVRSAIAMLPEDPA